MKRFIAVLLSILTVVSLFTGVTAYGADSDVSVICADSNPVSYKEVSDSVFAEHFNLDNSMFDYEFYVILPDGNMKTLKAENDITDEDRKNTQYLCYGEAYVIVDECEEALRLEKDAVPVHIDLTVCEKENSGSLAEVGEYKLTVEKRLVSSYVQSITPVENIHDYVYAESDNIFLEDTKFRIVYWNGAEETVTAVKTSQDEVSHYTINGNKIVYDRNEKLGRIYISYLDSGCHFEINEIRPFPFDKLEIIDCELKGDMPVKLIYEITTENGTKTERYTKTVNGYSGYLDFICGYPVAYSTEGSKYVSTVEISVGGILKAERTYELQQQSFFQKLIAKIVLFFKAIFAAGIF